MIICGYKEKNKRNSLKKSQILKKNRRYLITITHNKMSICIRDDCFFFGYKLDSADRFEVFLTSYITLQLNGYVQGYVLRMNSILKEASYYQTG